MFIGTPNIITIGTGVYNKVSTLKKAYATIKNVKMMNDVMNMEFNFIDKEVFKRKEQPKTNNIRHELKVVNGGR